MNIEEICKRYDIINYTINDDGSIDVDGDVFLYNKKLNELPLVFNKVTGYFGCGYNKLTTLKGSPRWIGGSFSCAYNKLRDLEYSPDYVGGWFDCYDNQLTDNYCETEILGDFITSLKQDGLIFKGYKAKNYNEWRKLYIRKKILDKIF
jgi:hypothetical protein